MTIEEMVTEADIQAIRSIKERIDACERKKYTSGVLYWRFQLQIVLKEIEEKLNAD